MVSKRAGAWSWTGAAVALVSVSGLVVGEVVAREQLTARTASVSGSLPGVSIAPVDGLALGQLISGSIAVRVTVTDAALDAVARCRTDQDLTVRTVAGGVLVSVERSLRGAPVTVEVLLVAQHDGAGWRLVADSVSAAGISLPAERALTLLSGRGGEGADVAERLLDGIPLALPGVRVSDVEFRSGAVELSAGLPLTRDDDGATAGNGFAAVRECLDPSASPEVSDPPPSEPSDQEG